ncbi:hypothetical protein K457DRAFT_141111 [Linnemannia elongata AG-77]|uniref:Extracellular membrane protein CFEM domain-containing protein n=1 Tax=Linnemannia elongata AG-77 TaxID=1314771 RepID=A0A197JLU1_9FUNG|nr:hypothetical protein K457DRAFT_141111 [Linnemannia elongata AG-77]
MLRNILAAATLSMTLAALVFACSDSDSTIRCGGIDGWKDTTECMKELGNNEDCYCRSNDRYYAVANNNYMAFQACCDRKSNFGWGTC